MAVVVVVWEENMKEKKCGYVVGNDDGDGYETGQLQESGEEESSAYEK